MPTYDSPGGHDRRQQMFDMIFGYRVRHAMVPGGRVGCGRRTLR
jgi:hypothetical protein